MRSHRDLAPKLLANREEIAIHSYRRWRKECEVFDTLHEAEVLIERWRVPYHRVRLHASRGYRPPAPEAWLIKSPVPLRSTRPFNPNAPTLINVELVANMGKGKVRMARPVLYEVIA